MVDNILGKCSQLQCITIKASIALMYLNISAVYNTKESHDLLCYTKKKTSFTMSPLFEKYCHNQQLKMCGSYSCL
jgi:hypothetical protein